MDGYYYISKCDLPAIYGQASAFLRHAKESYEALQAYIEAQAEGLKLAEAYLRIRT